MNLAIITGRLGADPELKYTKDGRAVATFSLATSEKWRDKVSGEYVEQTEWHNCVAFGRVAEVAGEYLKKGRQTTVRGKLKTDKWEKDGITRYTTKIHVEPYGLEMLGSKAENEGGRFSHTQDGGKSYHNQGASGYDGHKQPPPPPMGGSAGSNMDDIPF